ncbi:MAG: hypothetical protein KF768_14285 [Phycisphaeraceae bacterium]|nr:hypothetical protein [Phycisphaeraceae bacterium]
MSYRTRPYIPLLPMVPNPLKVYAINRGRLSVRFLGQLLHELPLDLSRVDTPSGVLQFLMHWLIDRGDLVISDSGGRVYNLRRVMGVKAFRAAVKEVVTNDDPNGPSGPPWYDGLHTDDTVVVIPRCPDQFSSLLYYARSGSGMFGDALFSGMQSNILVKEGDWVRRGQRIATSIGSDLLSPVDGRVARIGITTPWPWCRVSNWTEYWGHWSQQERSAQFLLAIYPVRGRRIEGLDFVYGPMISRLRTAISSDGYKSEVLKGLAIDPTKAEEHYSTVIDDFESIVASMVSSGITVRHIDASGIC